VGSSGLAGLHKLPWLWALLPAQVSIKHSFWLTFNEKL